jgi:hypothetical protein
MSKLKYTASVILLLALASCKKDFLQRDPGVAINEDKVFSDPLLAYRFADNTYNFLLDDFGRLGTAQTYKGMTGQFSDEAIFAEAIVAHGVLTMNQGKFLDDASGDVGRVYTRMYQGIRNANIMLSKLDTVPVDPAVFNRNLVEAQQLFLRAFFYFELVKRFGGVTLLEKPLSSTDELDLPRNTYAETIAFIVKDLQKAESLFSAETWGTIYTPDGWNSQNNNRATLGAVRALRSRLLLFDASPLNNPSGDAVKWKNAANAAKSIIDMNKFSLHNAYATILNQSTSPEYIMIKVRPARNGNGGFLGDYIIPPSYGGAQGQVNPTQNHVDLYEMSNGKLITDPTSGYNPQDPYRNRDPRLAANILYNDFTWQGRKVEMWFVKNADNSITYGRDYQPGSTSYTRTRYYSKKLWPEAVRGGQSTSANLNFIFFRYGEILLNYAEALNESDGPVAQVYSTVNLIRTRAGMPNLPAGLTKDQMRQRIHNERAVELAFEEFRWWDLLRWKKAKEVITKPMNAIDVEKKGNAFTYTVIPLAAIYQRVFEDHMYLYPIPRNEIFKSNDILKQNPGW